jgi:hypothetical protein
MRQQQADRLEHAHPTVGPFSGIYRQTRTVTLLIENVRCKPASNLHPNPCLGGSVSDLAVESTRNPVGLLFE